MDLVVWCGSCGTILDESPDIPLGERPPCPKCQDPADRIIGPPLSKREGLYIRAGDKGGPPSGKHRYSVESMGGFDYHRDSKKLRIVNRTINRRDNEYHEKVIDPETGEVLREVHEPLTKHRGRGAARRSSSKKEPPS